MGDSSGEQRGFEHIGTDIGGSIRLPGTWRGVVAVKPSFGRVPLDSPYLGRVAGPLTRTAADAALAMAVAGACGLGGWLRGWPGSGARPAVAGGR